jgi:hypothetical protein
VALRKLADYSVAYPGRLAGLAEAPGSVPPSQPA